MKAAAGPANIEFGTATFSLLLRKLFQAEALLCGHNRKTFPATLILAERLKKILARWKWF